MATLQTTAVTGSLTVTGQLIAQSLNVQQVTSSIVYSSGSNIFGKLVTDVQQLTGSLRVTGSGEHWIMGGSVGIGTTGPAQKLDVRGYIVSDSQGNSSESAFYLGNASHGLSRANLQNDIVLYTTSGDVKISANTVSSTQLIIKNGGNVGIGTTDPSEKLDVFGKIQVRPLANNNSGNYWYMIGSITDVTNYGVANGIVVESAGNNSYAMTFGTQNTYLTGITEKMRITSDGNIGIGTTSPTDKLEVRGVDNGITISSLSANRPVLQFVNGSTMMLKLSANGTYGAIADTTGDLMIFKGGSVGIGTTSPTVPLHVIGNILVTGTSPTFTGGALEIQGTANAVKTFYLNRYGVANGSQHRLRAENAYFEIASANSEPIVLTGGCVGIGTTAPPSKLTISNAGAEGIELKPADSTGVSRILFFNRSDSTRDDAKYDALTHQFLINIGTEAMRINSSGSVGIGVTDPLARLHAGINISDTSTQTFTNTGAIITSVGVDQTASRTNVLSLMRDGTNAVVYAGLAAFDMSRWSADSVNTRVQLDLRLSNTDTADLANVMSWRSNGNVGIGTGSPNDKLDVAGRVYAYRYIAVSSNATSPAYATDTSTGLFNAATNQIGISINGTEKVRIDSNGNVGIGTTNPTAKLRVDGTSNVIELRQSSVGSATYYVMDNTVETGGKRYRFGYSGASSDKGSFTIYNETDSITPFIILTGGNVGIGTITAPAKLTVSGSAAQMLALDTSISNGPYLVFRKSGADNFYIGSRGAVSGTGGTGYDLYSVGDLRFFANSGGSATMTITGSSVGIGTTSPSQKLEVTGIIRGEALNPYGSTDPASTSPYLYSPSLAALGIGMNGSEKVRITSGGNVGIGTTSPATKLEVLSAGGALGSSVTYPTDTNGVLLRNSLNVANTGSGIWFDHGGLQAGIASARATTGDWGTDLRFYTHPTTTSDQYIMQERMRINASGCVGIGTTSPSTKLEVAGDIRLGGTSTYNSVAVYNSGATGGGGFLAYQNGVVQAFFGALGWYEGNTNTGTVIGTDSASRPIVFYTSTERMRIAGGGNVGIGTTSPAEKLHVAGGYRFNGGNFYTSYTSNGLWGASATPSLVGSSGYVGSYSKYGNGGILIGYQDNGSGLYSPAYGFEVKSTDGRPVAGNVVAALIIKDTDTNNNPWTVNNNGDTYIYNTDPQITLTRSDNAGSPAARINFSTDGGTVRWQVATNQAVGTGFEINQGNATSNRFYINTSGNVGINTTSPSYKLEVNGAAGFGTTTRTEIGNAATDPLSAGVNYGIFHNSGVGLGIASGAGGSTQGIAFWSHDGTSFFRSMTITGATGNVGIGTTAPSYKLDIAVAQSIRVRGSSTGYTQGSIIFQSSTTDTPEARGLGVYAFNEGTDATWFYGTAYNAADSFVVNRKAGTTYQDAAASVGESSTFLLVNNAGNVGIGVTSPLARLHAGVNVSDISSQTFTNTGAIITSIGVDQTASRTNVLSLMRDGTSGVVYAGLAAFDMSRWSADSVNTRVQLDLRLSNTDTADLANVMSWRSNGNVGIGSTSPAYALDVSGTIRATGDVIAYSDARVKENVKTIEAPLDLITKLRGVTYTRKDTDDKSRKVGVIAQEVLPILPEVVQKDTNGNYSVAYGNIVGVLIEAIKELKAEIDILKNK